MLFYTKMLRRVLDSTGDFYFALLNLLYPQDCLVCSSRIRELKTAELCGPCSDRMMTYVDTPHWSETEKEFAFDAAYHIASYDDIVKKCICLFKYDGKTRLSKILGAVMAEYAALNFAAAGIDVVVPVPLHPVKQRERQFNQSDMIAEHIAKRLGVDLRKNWLKRIKYTSAQTGLTREQRLRNLKGAFLVRHDADLRDKTVLLVDDVMTTGATLHECSKAVKSAGAKRVLAYSLARGN